MKSMQKLQSALDYLTTYGWAVLVIGIAIGALYYLGAFGGASSLVIPAFLLLVIYAQIPSSTRQEALT